jgi:predicted branched-subunit amino acid permease
MSAVIFGGASQLVAVRLLARDEAASVVVLAVALVNLRHLLYGASIAPYLASAGRGWRWLLAYLLTDEAYATAMLRFRREGSSPRAHWYLFGAASALWAVWQATTALGVLAGTAVPDGWSLDFALPLTFLAMLVPALTGRSAVAAAGLAAVVAVVGFRWPYGTGVLGAIVLGMLAGILAARWSKDAVVASPEL